jgi:hypothetical protein
MASRSRSGASRRQDQQKPQEPFKVDMPPETQAPPSDAMPRHSKLGDELILPARVSDLEDPDVLSPRSAKKAYREVMGSRASARKPPKRYVTHSITFPPSQRITDCELSWFLALTSLLEIYNLLEI